MKKIFSLFLASLLALNPILSRADMIPGVLALPVPGAMVSLSQPFSPSLLRGMIVHPDKPLQFDFILDIGDGNLTGDALTQESQRMINYFLTTLAIPQKDLWVNLSPVEKDRIVPDALIKTELGRDLLAEDYMLKQLTASLIYPEDGLGKFFWDKIYTEAYQKFGTTEVPVDVFNKVWIIPDTAAVVEKGDTVYIAQAHLKVLLAADYMAMQAAEGKGTEGAPLTSGIERLTANILREVVLPAIEKEVNEGRNFAQLRQMIYAMILAQWYQDVFKESVLNKAYSSRSKLAGIDLSDPGAKQFIYQQYLAAFKKGVFNYIKEETDGLTLGSVPRKYFSGGFKEQRFTRMPVDLALIPLSGQCEQARLVRVSIDPAQNDHAQSDFIGESHEVWNDLNRPLALLEELKGCWGSGSFDQGKASVFFKKYSPQIDVEAGRRNPVQGAWPVLKAVVSLEADQERVLVDWLEQSVPKESRTRLMEQVLLMSGRYDLNWVNVNAPYLVDLPYYFVSMEIDFKAGGLGPVNVTHTKFLQRLGAAIRTIQPMYTTRFDTGVQQGVPLKYAPVNGQDAGPNLGFTELKKVAAFKINIGKTVNVEVWEGVNKEGVSSYLIKDVQPDGTSYYTKTLYRYQTQHNSASMEETMAFFNVAAAEWIHRLEQKRAQEVKEAYALPVIHPQDGQMGPFIATVKSRHPELEDAFFMGTTHTVLNAGANGLESIEWFLKGMLGITPKYIPAFITRNFFDASIGEAKRSVKQFVQYTKAMQELVKSGLRTGVSWTHAVRDMSKLYELPLIAMTNGDDPDRIAAFFRESLRMLQEQQKIPDDVDPNQLLPWQARMVKELCAERFNHLKVLTARGEDLLNQAKAMFGQKYAAEGRRVETLTDLKDEDAYAIMRWATEWLEITFKDGDDGLAEFRSDFYVHVDLKMPKVGSARRLVFEKNNFDPGLINMLVRLGFDVVIFGNHQGVASEELATRYKMLEQDINETKKKDSNQYPGKFFFVQHFTEEQKIALIGMVNVYMMLNKKFLGANELWEENPFPSYGYMMALHHRDGATTDVLIPIDFDNPGSGSLLMLKDGGSINEWLADLVRLKELWDQGTPFFENAVLSARMSRIGQGQLTAAAYLWEVNSAIDREKKEREADHQRAQKIAVLMGNDPDSKRQILETGVERITPFYFHPSLGNGRPAVNAGLKGFLGELQKVEQEHGYNSLFKQMAEQVPPEGLDQPPGMRAVYSRFLLALFNKAPQSKEEFNQWLIAWENDHGSLKDRDERFQRFLDDLIRLIEHPVQAQASNDPAQAQGGIDARNISVDRQGGLVEGVVSDSALEEVLMNAPGVRGVIVNMTPMTDLRSLLGMK